MSRRSVVVLLGLAVVLVVVIGVIGGGDDRGEPLHPDNTEPSGTRALVLLAEELGNEVSVSDNEPGTADVVVLLRDRLLDDSHDRLRRFVDDGGTIVVADPTSPLAAPAGRRAPGSGNTCTIQEWDDYDITQVAPAVSPLDPDGGPFCLGTETGAVVTTRTMGDGVVISVSAASLFTNRFLGQADNARLAAAAVAPGTGGRIVVFDPSFVETPLPGTGDQSLWELVPSGVKWGLLQLAIGFGVFVLAVSRRHGRPVPEGPVVELASSDLIAATGTMYERARQPAFAASVLQDDLRRVVAQRTGLAADAPTADLAAAAEVRFGLSAARVQASLDSPVADESQLLDVAHALSQIRQEVLDG